MRKIVFTAMVLVVFAFSAKSQLYYLGFKSGISFTSMTDGYLGKEYEDLGGTKYLFSVPFDYFVSDYFSLAPEFMYFRKGTEYYKKESATTIETRSDRYRFSYLQLPLTVKVRYPFDMFSIYALAGPYVSFLVGGHASEQGTAIIGMRTLLLKDFFAERQQEFTRFDVGFDLGAGAEIDLGQGRILLNIRYDIGFIPVAKDQDVSPFLYKSMGANRAWSIEAGYAIRID